MFDPAKDDAAAAGGAASNVLSRSLDAPRPSATCSPGPGVFALSSQDGFVLARAAGGEAEILTLAVAPAARGQGLGRALLQAAAAHAATLGAQSMFLEVGADNPAALALYAGLGFVRAGQRKAYYAAPVRTPGC